VRKRVLTRAGWIAAAAGFLLVLILLSSNFYEYETVTAVQMRTGRWSESGWSIKHTYGPDNAIVELKRPRLHLP
jgi:hypothetical protein